LRFSGVFVFFLKSGMNIHDLQRFTIISWPCFAFWLLGPLQLSFARLDQTSSYATALASASTSTTTSSSTQHLLEYRNNYLLFENVHAAAFAKHRCGTPVMETIVFHPCPAARTVIRNRITAGSCRWKVEQRYQRTEPRAAALCLSLFAL